MSDTKEKDAPSYKGPKVKLRYRSDVGVPGFEGMPGDVKEVPKELADRLVKRRAAVDVLAEEKAKKEAAKDAE